MRLSVLLLTACSTAEPVIDALAPEGAPAVEAMTGDGGFAIPRGGLVTLSTTPLVPGAPYTMTVTGVGPGELVHVARSTRGLGPGPCLGTLGGLCLDVAPPVAIHASAVADGDGVVTYDLLLPPFVPIGASVAFQAVVPRGDTGFAWLESDVLEDVTTRASVTVAEMEVGDLVITEVMANPTAPYGEWFEVVNATDEDMDLRGLVVAGAGDFVVDRTVYLPPGQRAVLAASSDPAVNGGLPAVDATWGARFSLADTWGEIALVGDAGVLDVVAWDDGTSWPLEPGLSMGLTTAADPALNDLGANWCSEDEVYGAGDRGSPGVAGACYDTCERVGELLWCYHPTACGVPCEGTCEAVGLAPIADSVAWFEAQDTEEECQQIADAFGHTEPVLLSDYRTACIQDEGPHVGPELVGRFFCSTSASCPDNLRDEMDALGRPCEEPGSRLAVCPCE